MFCHGNPVVNGDHCCWVDGARCPNLLEGQEVADAVQVQIDLYNFKGPANNLARKLGDGINFACGVAIKVIAESIDSTSQLPDRPTFEAAWTAHADYQAIADAWEAMGKPRSWCPEYGPAEGQCCFAEDQATNDTRGAGVPVELKNLRRALDGAS